MSDFRSELSCLDGQVAFLGLGNTELGDDGVGVRLAERLAINGLPHVLVAGTDPGLLLGRCQTAAVDHVVFLDAVEFGGAPGSVVFLNAGQIVGRFPQISTHKLSLGLVAKCIEGDGMTHSWLLGVQPKSLEHSRQLSPPVSRAVEILAEALTALFSHKATA